MRSFAERLFGRDAGRLLELIVGETGEERRAADRVRDADGWCGTTPGNVRGPRPGRPIPTRAPRRAAPRDWDWRG